MRYYSITLAFLISYVLSETLRTSSEREECQCDQLKGVCEYLCCCDSDTCTSDQKALYSTYTKNNQCTESNIGSQYRIPLFKDISKVTVSLEDLYSPYRFAYQLTRMLGSVVGGQYKKTISQDLKSPSETKVYKTILDNKQNFEYNYKDLPFIIQPQERLVDRITSVELNTFFIRDQATGNCISYTQTPYETVNFQACKPTKTQIAEYRKNVANITPKGGCINLDNSYQKLQSDLIAVACTTFTNAIGTIYSQGVPIVLINDSAPRIFLGGAVYNDLTEVVISKPKKGYTFGELLRFKDSASASKGIILNSIYDITGNCLTSAKINMLNPLNIGFGQNFTTTCKGSLFATSYLHQVASLALFQQANPSYTGDWIAITSATASNLCTSNYVISISYQKQGKLSNPTFFPTSSQKYCFSGPENVSSFSVVFIEESQSPVYYMSSPPEIKSKLARDVLYPFFEFND